MTHDHEFMTFLLRYRRSRRRFHPLKSEIRALPDHSWLNEFLPFLLKPAKVRIFNLTVLLRFRSEKPALRKEIMAEEQSLDNIKIDGSNLWKEENFTDLKVGSIRKLTPIKLDGSEDEIRSMGKATGKVVERMYTGCYRSRKNRESCVAACACL